TKQQEPPRLIEQELAGERPRAPGAGALLGHTVQASCRAARLARALAEGMACGMGHHDVVSELHGVLRRYPHSPLPVSPGLHLRVDPAHAVQDGPEREQVGSRRELEYADVHVLNERAALFIYFGWRQMLRVTRKPLDRSADQTECAVRLQPP